MLLHSLFTWLISLIHVFWGLGHFISIIYAGWVAKIHICCWMHHHVTGSTLKQNLDQSCGAFYLRILNLIQGFLWSLPLVNNKTSSEYYLTNLVFFFCFYTCLFHIFACESSSIHSIKNKIDQVTLSHVFHFPILYFWYLIFCSQSKNLLDFFLKCWRFCCLS